ncbi:MAG: hypothetical protein JWM68_2141 [Verrucomicrobiales bacterium]|nr:hypothetical protein [Verrucomicrobiales bacterium]
MKKTGAAFCLRSFICFNGSTVANDHGEKEKVGIATGDILAA